jgi:hypothetical protein
MSTTEGKDIAPAMRPSRTGTRPTGKGKAKGKATRTGKVPFGRETKGKKKPARKTGTGRRGAKKTRR